MLEKVLIANRGEIAVRIVRACHELGLQTVVAYSEADRDSLAVRLSDEAVCIGPPPAAKSYLHAPSLISAALISGCDAVHPGYGFLSENPYFAEIIKQCGLTYIGPEPDVIAIMGDKAAARAAMRDAGLPVMPGSEQTINTVDEARELAAGMGYPVLLKAAAGGGGRGMRIVPDEAELPRAFATAKAEAEAAFGSGALYMEKFLPVARHIEIQVLGDNYGNVIHLGERECSIQRRHQKLLEEAPSTVVDAELRERMGAAAVAGAKTINYTGVGTMEFLMDPQGNYYFIEMNTRIQVEHPVTEWVTGLDLVKWQLRVAAGERLTLQQADVRMTGHAIECRVNAEDPARDFMPQAGEVDLFLPPGGPGVRIDSHLYSSYVVPPNYDSLLAKIIVWGADRAEAITRMQRALDECIITGVKTTIPFQQALLEDANYRRGDVSTRYLNEFIERQKQ
ncbi:MAG: acetyl-CoA carboxylase biotin carboxylase subunit [Chloroflexota bacterium]|nr:acetyl-CoA carboxylase biotin carboxylase subunit [Chloroflexota bacterium]PLS77312.1 MAG: acetyl-CoA carboxylase biotin carboxylase subunit [Chloroflexota bacterium]